MKLRLVAGLLDLRCGHPALFAKGSYTPVTATGPRADDLVAFVREHDGKRLFVAVALRVADWSGTSLALGHETLDASALFADRSVTARLL